MRAVGYIRCSTPGQVKFGVSLEAQRDKVKTYAMLKDLDLIEVVEDAGISAKNMLRPGVQQVLNMVARHEVEAVIIYKLDRMFRSTVDALETTKFMDKHKVALHSISESLDTRSAMGQFFFTLVAALSELERRLISERTKTALAHKKKSRKVYGQIPYGFKRVGNDLVEDDEEQSVIKLVLRLRRKGFSMADIANNLNSQQIKPKRGDVFHPMTIKGILNAQEMA